MLFSCIGIEIDHVNRDNLKRNSVIRRKKNDDLDAPIELKSKLNIVIFALNLKHKSYLDEKLTKFSLNSLGLS